VIGAATGSVIHSHQWQQKAERSDLQAKQGKSKDRSARTAAHIKKIHTCVLVFKKNENALFCGKVKYSLM
jgi:hypothetical protein